MNHSVFAIEICMRLEPGSLLRTELRELVATHPAVTTPGQKWHLLRRICQLLLANEHLFVSGCWDFFDSNERAIKDYDMWSNGLITEEGSRTEPSGDPYTWGKEPRFMTFTISFLLVQGTQCERDLCKLCEIPQNQLWKKATFIKILQGLGVMNFAAVKSDVLYLIPGEESWGLTAEDMRQKKFEYLRQIEMGKNR